MLQHSEPIDGVLHALAAPARRRIVDRLGHGPASVSELADPSGMSMPATLQHLRLLEAAGLVRTEKVGRTRTCSLDPAGLRHVDAWVRELRGAWEHKLDRLDAHLAAEDER